MEDDLADLDTHLCLACNQTIIGLMDYVVHKKSQCQKRRSQPQQQQQHHDHDTYSQHLFGQPFSSRGSSGAQPSRTQNELLVGGTSSHGYELRNQDSVMLSSTQPSGDYGRRVGSYGHASQNLSTSAYNTVQSGGGHHSSNAGLSVDVNSPLVSFMDSAFSPGDDSPIDPNSVLQSSEPPRSRPDFFQSLELKSIAGRETKARGTQGRNLRSRKRGLQDSALDLDLPITMILSNLDFSSDEEESGVVGFPSEEEESDVSDTELEWSSPPKTHTGGKWKPGQGPTNKYHPHRPVGGKWKPGQGPHESKPQTKKGVRADSVKYTKPFFCNVCKGTFPNRFSYNGHFEGKTHKDAVPTTRTGGGRKAQRCEEDQQLVIELDPTTGEFRETAAEPESDSVSQAGLNPPPGKKKNFSGAFCETCDLFFDSIQVYRIHCDTKQHKENVEKLSMDLQEALLGPDGHSDSGDGNPIQGTEPGRSGRDTGPADHSEGQAVEGMKQTQPETHFCVVCRKTFKRKYEMARHLLTHFHKQRAMKHPKALEMLDKYNKYVIRLCPFQCNVCQFYFNRASDLRDHLQTPGHELSCNDLVGPLLCVTCKYKTYSPDTMLQHVQSRAHKQAVASNHHVCIIKECHSKITCKYCGVQMHSAVRMKRHIDFRHKNRKVNDELQVRTGLTNRLTCPECNKDFRNRSTLLRHYQSHQGPKPFRCEVCDKSFTELRRLESHLSTSLHERRVNLVKDKSGVIQVSNSEDEEIVEEKLEEVENSENQDRLDSSKPRRSGRPRKPKNFGCMFEDGSQTAKSLLNSPEMLTSKCADLAASDLSVQNDIDGAECPDVDDVKGQSQVTTMLTVENEEVGTSIVKSEGLEDLQNPASCQTPGHKEELADDGEAGNGRGGAPQNKRKETELTVQAKARCKGTGLFTCEHCDFCGDEMEELKKHYTREHPSDLILCEPCDQFFLSQKAYRIHCAGGNHQGRLRKAGSSKLELKACPHCDKKFTDDETYELHVEFVHLHISTEEAVQRVCQGRDMVTQLYGDHLQQLNNISHDSSVACPECGRFVMKNNVIEHLRVHTGERPFKCRHCTRDFGSRISLRRHLIEHIRKNVYKCETCGKVFKKQGPYTFHQRLHVSERKGLKFDCDVCGASFLLERQLAYHKKRHGERSFKCTVPGCHWAFVLRTELTHHMATHTGEKKYLCDICGWAAPNTTRLRRHARSHQPPKMIPCEYCPYKAGTKFHMRRHMRIHIGAKPFKCLYCTYACNTHENMRKHILKTRKHQGRNIYPCKFCEFATNEAKDFKNHLMLAHLDYVKSRPSESLVKFTGLYNPEEDVKKPPEGGEIHQVTKGRFIKVYDGTRIGGTGDPVGPPKTSKKKKAKHTSRMMQAEGEEVLENQDRKPNTYANSGIQTASLSVSQPVVKASNSAEQIAVRVTSPADQVSARSSSSDSDIAVTAPSILDMAGRPVSLATEEQEPENPQPLTFSQADMAYPRGLPWTVVAQENLGGAWCQSVDVVVPHPASYRSSDTVQIVSEAPAGTAYLRGPNGEVSTILTMVNVDSQTFQQIEASGYQVIAAAPSTVSQL